jgi:hypothetical protein
MIAATWLSVRIGRPQWRQSRSVWTQRELSPRRRVVGHGRFTGVAMHGGTVVAQDTGNQKCAVFTTSCVAQGAGKQVHSLGCHFAPRS